MSEAMLNLKRKDMNKLKAGKVLQLKPDMMNGDQRLILKPEQMKKLSAAMKKQKGFRLQFDGPQIEQHIGAGLFTTVRRKAGLPKTLAVEPSTVGGFSFKKLGRSMKKGFQRFEKKMRPVGKVLENAARQTTKQIIEHGITKGAEVLGSTIGTMVATPLGMPQVGSFVGAKMAGNIVRPYAKKTANKTGLGCNCGGSLIPAGYGGALVPPGYKTGKGTEVLSDIKDFWTNKPAFYRPYRETVQI